MSSLIALSCAALLPAGALAQTSAPSKPGDRGTTERGTADRAKAQRETWTNTQGLHETGDLIGARVENTAGKEVGKVDALERQGHKERQHA